MTYDELPDWIKDIYLSNAGATPIMYVPRLLREWAESNGLEQREGEDNNSWVARLREAAKQHFST